MSTDNTAPRKDEPASRRSAKLDKTVPDIDPELRHEIGDVRDLIGHLQGVAETGFFGPPSKPQENNGPADLKSLESLANPLQHTQQLDLSAWKAEETRQFLKMQILIRAVEKKLGEMVEAGDIVCPVHLAIGQEAPPTGISHWLTPEDRVFGAHRSHGHYLALGGNVYQLFAEVLGREDGCSRGMGGSMHLYGPEVGFRGSVPIVAATVPVAVGAALAAKKDGTGQVAIAYFGDGAVEEGGVHESLNLAAQMNLPVLFVCENNLYASHMDIAQRQPNDRTARIAEAHAVPTAVIDGNDVIAVANTAGDMIHRARCGEGPGYLEAITYRWRGHVGPDENIDVGLRRSPEELAAWKRRDPVARLRSAMIDRGDITEHESTVLDTDVEATVVEAAERAYKAPWPDNSALLDYVYVENK